MPTKRSIIVGLVGVNLFLLVALAFSGYSLPAAYGQAGARAYNYLAVTCQVDEDYDVFYVLDLDSRRLHAFAPSRDAKGALQHLAWRDLSRDFGSGR